MVRRGWRAVRVPAGAQLLVEIAPPSVSGPAVELVAAAAGFVGVVPISKLLQHRIGRRVECAHLRSHSLNARQTGRGGGDGGAKFVAGLL